MIQTGPAPPRGRLLRHFNLTCVKTRLRAPRYAAPMQLPLQITFRGVAHSPAIEAAIREKAAKLEHHFDRIISCRVVVEQPAQHQRQGKPFTVRLDIKVPGGEIAITHEHDEDLDVALHQAFDAARRKLEDHVRVQRGDVKAHRPASAGD